MTVQEQAVAAMVELRRKPGLFEMTNLLGILAEELYQACGYRGELDVLSDLLKLTDQEALCACRLIPSIQVEDLDPELGFRLVAEESERPSAS